MAPARALALLGLAACSSSLIGDGTVGGDGGTVTDARPGGDIDARPGGAIDARPGGTIDARPGGDIDARPGGDIDAGVVSAAPTCALPFGPVDVSSPTTVVGAGATSCDATSLAAAVTKGGITFACGGAATIHLTAELTPPRNVDTTIDGGGVITLDGGGQTRILRFDGGDYRKTGTRITLQHLTLTGGHASGSALPSEAPPCSQGFDTDAGGGAVLVRDGVLHVVDCTFAGNAGATPGPDVAGGGVYVNGSKETVIMGSRFTGNTASNGGAVGALNSDLAIYTSVLADNTATGTGGNNTSDACSSPSHEIGDGGSGGAVYMDGGSEGDTVFCGVAFTGNHANALGGAIFRVYDIGRHALVLDQSTLDGNVCDGPTGTDGTGSSAGALYAHNTDLRVTASTIANNTAPTCGAVQADATVLDFTNVTLAGNIASHGIGGGLCIFSEGGTLASCTLAGNQANGGSSFSDFYGAAIFGGNLTIQNSLIADNTTENSMGRMSCAHTEAGSHDLQWPKNKVVGGSADSECVSGITFADPQLGSLPAALTDNGGPTRTMRPTAAPAVIQIGSGCPPTDQTGRPRADPCTLGALEN